MEIASPSTRARARAHDCVQEAGISRKLAPTIGISVDPRRQNLSEESLKANVERLKAYKARLVLFPRKTKAPKSGDASAEQVQAAKQAGHAGAVKESNKFFPIEQAVAVTEGKLSDYPSEEKAFRKLREARSEARLRGRRDKRAKAKAEEAEAQKK
jgi:large subunit ribosomal protein L13e